TTKRTTPVAVGAPPGISLSGVSSRGNATHTCAVGSDARVYCWGQNDKGQLGDGTTIDRKSPVAALLPAQVQVARVEVGVSRTCAESTAGNVYCWGDNQFGQLGDSTTTSSPTPVMVRAPNGISLSGVSNGIYHSCAHGSDSKLYCWGRND